MTENYVNPPINNDPMEKRNEFIDHPSYYTPQLQGVQRILFLRSIVFMTVSLIYQALLLDAVSS